MLLLLIVCVFEFERKHCALRLLYTLVAPAFAAHGHIALVAADFYLRTFLDKIAGGIDAGIYDGLVPAIAG